MYWFHRYVRFSLGSLIPAPLQNVEEDVSILILMDIALKAVRCSNDLITNGINVFCSGSFFVKQYVKEPF